MTDRLTCLSKECPESSAQMTFTHFFKGSTTVFWIWFTCRKKNPMTPKLGEARLFL